jgi:hypothetical protein
VSLDPVGEAYHGFIGAQRTARYNEALRFAARRDTTYFDRKWEPWDGRLADVLHIVGRYDDQLRVARDNVHRRGFTVPTAILLVPAFATRGREREVDSLLALVWAMPPDSASRRSAPAFVALETGWEYLAHHQEERARSMFQKAVGWYVARPAAEQSRWIPDRAEALLLSGRLGEARRIYDSLTRVAPDNDSYHGMLGVTALLLGDSARMREVDTHLSATMQDLLRQRARLVWRGRLAALRGDCDAAVGLFRTAWQRGREGEVVHHRWAMFGKARSCAGVRQLLASRD